MDSRKKEYDEINRKYEESGLSLKKFAESGSVNINLIISANVDLTSQPWDGKQ